MCGYAWRCVEMRGDGDDNDSVGRAGFDVGSQSRDDKIVLFQIRTLVWLRHLSRARSDSHYLTC